MDDLDLHTPPRMSTSFRIVESQPKPFLWAKSNQWLGLTSEENTFSSRHFQRYLLVGGLVFSVMSLPLFNEFCELRRAPWRWDFCQCLGDMTLASSKLEEDLMVFCLFSPGIFEHLLELATTQKTSGKDSTGYFDSRWWALCTYPSFKESRVLGSRI